MDLNDNSNSFINLMFSSSFYPTISKPTRITKSTATLIDNGAPAARRAAKRSPISNSYRAQSLFLALGALVRPGVNF